MIKRMMVRYKMKADRVAENEGYSTRVFKQLGREQPAFAIQHHTASSRRRS